LTENSPIRTQRNDTQKLILVDLVDDDEDPGPQTSDLQLTMRDLKKRKIITHPIVIVIDHHFIDFTLAGLVLICLNIFNVITDYFPFID
jgi:hypothetical protein